MKVVKSSEFQNIFWRELTLARMGKQSAEVTARNIVKKTNKMLAED